MSQAELNAPADQPDDPLPWLTHGDGGNEPVADAGPLVDFPADESGNESDFATKPEPAAAPEPPPTRQDDRGGALGTDDAQPAAPTPANVYARAHDVAEIVGEMRENRLLGWTMAETKKAALAHGYPADLVAESLQMLRESENSAKLARKRDVAKPDKRKKATPGKDGPGRQLNFNMISVKTDSGAEMVPIPRPYDDVIARMVDMAQGTIARVDDIMFIKPADLGGAVRIVTAAPQLFGHMGALNECVVEWRNMTGAMTKAEAHAEIIAHVEAFRGIETAPHVPPMPGLYYNHPELPPPDYDALDGLLCMFNPATDGDRALIVAMMVTAVWGGSEGQRPAFIITSPDGRGVGKSTLAESVSDLLGQVPTSGSSKQDMEVLKTRLLSPAAMQSRVVIFDNETGRVSSGELAGMITAQTISGRRLYAGEGRRPNNLLWVVTLNTPSLDSDLASRGIPIVIRRPVYCADWEGALKSHIKENRWGIISALADILQTSPNPAELEISRWGAWEREVLFRLTKWVPNFEVLQALIAERQRSFDDEADEISLIFDAFAEIVAREKGLEITDVAFLSNATASEVYNHATGARVRKNTAIRALREIVRIEAIPELQEHRHAKWGRGFLFVRKTALEGVDSLKLITYSGYSQNQEWRSNDGNDGNDGTAL